MLVDFCCYSGPAGRVKNLICFGHSTIAPFQSLDVYWPKYYGGFGQTAKNRDSSLYRLFGERIVDQIPLSEGKEK